MVGGGRVSHGVTDHLADPDGAGLVKEQHRGDAMEMDVRGSCAGEERQQRRAG